MDRLAISDLVAVLAEMYEDVDRAPAGLERLTACDAADVAPLLVHLGTTVIARCRRSGVNSSAELIAQVGAEAGEGDPFAYITGLLVADDDRSGAPSATAALVGDDTDVESVMFVLLALVVLGALVEGRSVNGYLTSLNQGERTEPLTADRPDAIAVPTAAAIATGLILPTLKIDVDHELGRAAPPPGFETGSISGPSSDPDFERALLAQLRVNVAAQSLRQAVAERCAVTIDDAMVDRVCALIGGAA